MSKHETGLYIYGIANSATAGIPGEMPGIDNIHPLIVLPVVGCFVFASSVDLDEYGAEAIEAYLQDMLWVKEKTQKHFAITQRLAKEQLLIPMKFCTIFLCEENLKYFVTKYQTAIKQAFTYFEDKEEWIIKLYCNLNSFMEQNMDEEKEELQNQSAGLSPGKAYFFNKKNTITLEARSKEKINVIRGRVWEELIPITEKAKINKNLSHQITERKEEMILNAAFLIKNQNINILTALGEKLDKQLTGLNMYAELIGPWPFYNFTELFIQEQKDDN